MTYRWFTDLDQALRSAGLSFQEVGPTLIDPTRASSWRDRGRPLSTGQHDPSGILCHHTADPGATVASNLAVILKGNSEAPGPISHLYISREPRLYLVAAGRANHGGRGQRRWRGQLVDTSCTDMNANLLGIEVSNNGVGEYWPDGQVDLYARTVAALCDWYGWDVSTQVWCHWTTGPQCGNYKIDPRGPSKFNPAPTSWDLDVWRHECAQYSRNLKPKPPDPVIPPVIITPEGEAMRETPHFVYANANTVGHTVDGAQYTCPVDGTYFYTDGTFQTIRHVTGDEKAAIESFLHSKAIDPVTWNTPVNPDTFGFLVGAIR